MPKTSKTTKSSTATVLFEDFRFPNQAITWKMGTNVLRLCAKGNPNAADVNERTSVVLRESRIRGGASDIASAEAEATKWWDSLDVFDDEDEDGEGEWID